MNTNNIKNAINNFCNDMIKFTEKYDKDLKAWEHGGVTAQEAMDNAIGGWNTLDIDNLPDRFFTRDDIEIEQFNRITELKTDWREYQGEINERYEIIAFLNTGKYKYRYRIQEKKETIKPPLGLTPKNIYYIDRFNEIGNAIKRYIDDNKDIPYEWTDEYNDLKYIID